MLGADGLHEEGEEAGLGDDGEDADGGDEHGDRLLVEVHDEAQVDEEAGVLARLGQVRQEHRQAEHQDRLVVPYLAQRRERIHLAERNGGLLALVLTTSKDESSHPL